MGPPTHTAPAPAAVQRGMVPSCTSAACHSTTTCPTSCAPSTRSWQAHGPSNASACCPTSPTWPPPTRSGVGLGRGGGGSQTPTEGRAALVMASPRHAACCLQACPSLHQSRQQYHQRQLQQASRRVGVRPARSCTHTPCCATGAARGAQHRLPAGQHGAAGGRHPAPAGHPLPGAGGRLRALQPGQSHLCCSAARSHRPASR